MMKTKASSASSSRSTHHHWSNTSGSRSSGRHEDPWMHRHFLRDTKLRVRERYWRPLIASASSITKSITTPDILSLLHHRYICLADALTWRKYLPLIQKMCTTEIAVGDTACSTMMALEFVLLESAVELLDHRSQAGESSSSTSSPQERSLLMRLVQQQKIRVFADLSVREVDDDNGGGEDEWDWMGYDNLSVEERCRHALVRAGRMIRAILLARSSSTSTSTSFHHPVYLVLSDEESVRYFRGVTLEEGLSLISMRDLMELSCGAPSVSATATVSAVTSQDESENNSSSNNKLKNNLRELLQACEEDYRRRNNKSRSQIGGSSPATKTTLSDDEQQVRLTDEQIRIGLKNGTLLRGRLEVSKDNPNEAFVTAEKRTYLVQKQRGHFQQAFHHDIVILRVLPKEEWGRSTPRLVYHRDTTTEDEENTTNDENASSLSAPPIPSARVAAIVQPSRRTFVATLLDLPKDNSSHILVVPMDVRIPKIRINAKSFPNYLNQRLLIQVDNWEAGSTYPQGRCLEVLGPIGDLETEVRALLLENQVALDPFSTAALACLPPQGHHWTIPLVQEVEQNRRRDLRTSRRIFSVDPPGCQDVDDSMHAHQLPKGDYEVGVHIADVTYFVPHDSALDLEAQARGTTFYLVDRRFDMLPSLLSSNLCSLHGQTDRLAVSVIWTLSPDFQQVKSCWFGRTVIHNCAAMTYDQADNILQGKRPDEPHASPPPPLTAGGPVDPTLIAQLRVDLTVLTKLARKLRRDREEVGGAVDLSSGDLGNELKFTLDVNGKPTKVVPKADKEIHHTIAELMILANTSVAEKISESMPKSALLRIHRTVEEGRFGDLREILEAYGVSFQGDSNMALAETLKHASNKKNSIVDALLKASATRAMSEAQYVCTGDIDQVDELSHYGLGLKKYTHFTSPIRRYADVVVHKQLLAALRLEQELNSKEQQHPTAGSVVYPRAQLPSLPDSNVVSILGGEGLLDSAAADDDELDALIEGASDLVLGPTSVEAHPAAGDSVVVPRQEPPAGAENDKTTTLQESIKPYRSFQVSQICEGLNLHNRLAKYSSSECQKLFLSLYFRDHVEVTKAVVVKLRANGFWCYVPKFDLRVPVYLKDMSEQVQIDPGLLGLPSDAGLPCSKGFASSVCRLLPLARCELLSGQSPDNEQQLIVSAPGAPSRLVLVPLQVVTIQLACENFDLRARVPAPRAHLLPSSSKSSSSSSTISSAAAVSSSDQDRVSGVITSSHLNKDRGKQAHDGGGQRISSNLKDEPSSLFQILSSLIATTRRSDTTGKASGERRNERQASAAVIPNKKATLEGRLIFGQFVNPDTRLARQEALQRNAAAEAAQRRTNIALAHASRHTEFDTSSRIAREATSRQQRLAAEKRNTRHSKAK